MNSAYLYDIQEASSTITNRIYYLLETHHWSIKTLSDESNIPYETLKKLLSRKTENTSFHNIMKIALALKCNLNDLVEPYNTFETPTPIRYLENSLDFCGTTSKWAPIPLLSPRTLLNVNSSHLFLMEETLDAATCPYDIRDDISYGIKITSLCYHPIYHEKDILLVSRNRPPHSGETGIFMHQKRIYIRIFSKVNHGILLESVNGLGQDILIHDFSDWNILGYVVGVQRR